MNWTREQAQAIDERNKNILVAAAAGSGKTTVLVERIRKLILEEGCSIENMLIVTFTNAAASEMKEKIRKALKKSIESYTLMEGEPEYDPSKIAFMKNQLDLLPFANVSTFHSFALEVIHRFFYLTETEPNFRICDETQKTLLINEAMDRLVEELFTENSEEFLQFMNKYSGDRNNDRFRETIQNTYEKIQALPEPFKWLREAVEDLNRPFREMKFFDVFWDDVRLKLENVLAGFQTVEEDSEREGYSGLNALTKLDIDVVKTVINSIDDRNFDAVGEIISSAKFATASKKYTTLEVNSALFHTQEEMTEYLDNFKAQRDYLKKQLKKVQDVYFSTSLEEQEELMHGTYADACLLEKYVKRFHELFAEGKSEKNLVDFNDIEHFAFEILKHEEAAAYYRKKFEHIVIDEYQDSNVLQEALIDRIARERNRFMVGDIKQSIYKFRLAEPEIFCERYEKYSQEMEKKNPDSMKIDLNLNFRSKKKIINFINDVFEDIMEGYDDNAKLYPGDSHADESYHEPKLYLARTVWDDQENVDDDLKTLIKAEKEAMAAVKIIRDSLGKDIYISSEGRKRPLEKKDVVILMRSIKGYGEHFYRVFTENNLPAFVDDNDGYFDTMEINTFMALMAVIDNEKQDIPLMTIMRSELFRFTIEEMVEIRIRHRKGSYHDALKEASTNESALGVKVLSMLEKLKAWKAMRMTMNLEDFMWEIMLETGFYVMMGTMPAGAQRQANLRALIDKALNYRKNQDGSLYGFMQYIEAIKKGKVSMGQVKLAGEGDDTIRIMTIHHSKGLEFPMVLLAGFSKQLQYNSVGRNVVMHKDIGLGMPYVDYKGAWYAKTLTQAVIGEVSRYEEVAEQKRVLYVALTRAKDILYILGTEDDPNEALESVKHSVPKDSSYFDMAGRAICKGHRRAEQITDGQLMSISGERTIQKARAISALEDISVKTGNDIRNRLEFEYPYMDELKIRSKYSVSDLNSRDRMSISELAEPESFKVRKTLTAAQVGTVTHKVLEKLDFCRVSEKEVTDLIDEMVAGEFFTEDEGKAVNVDGIVKFAACDLGRRIAEAQAKGKLYREKSFNTVMEVEGHESIVQGVIDCCFEEGDGMVLVDYKTTSVRSDAEFEARKDAIRENYRTQIEIYRNALEQATGRTVKEAYLYLTNIGRTIDMLK